MTDVKDPTLEFRDAVMDVKDPTLGFKDAVTDVKDPTLEFKDAVMDVKDAALSGFWFGMQLFHPSTPCFYAKTACLAATFHFF
ncbi:hypothetical protein [Chryseolinea lacunae]|uniref:Uncharacterized protein n=1 Tax=Chryseolinea lacunae TaxID=2801331 RepID=A0ABS1KKD3_9BACT|nr:hypothetical protein [Chryseolinea lacunae]MBL0739914.1 hypothetical protein [Chryseolinea lacunae]